MLLKIITRTNSYIGAKIPILIKQLNIQYNQSTCISIIYIRMKGTIMESIVQAKHVLEIFKEMSQIPRESGNEKGISDYIVNFGKNLGLEVNQDEQYNVVIKNLLLLAMKIVHPLFYKVISIWYVYEIMTPTMTFPKTQLLTSSKASGCMQITLH